MCLRQWIPTAISNLTTLQSGRHKTILGHILIIHICSGLCIQDYCWEDHGYSLVNRLYPDVGQLIDEKFHIAYNLTYNTMAMHKDVDTSMLRRAIWNYIQCMFGIRLVFSYVYMEIFFHWANLFGYLEHICTQTHKLKTLLSPVAYLYAYASESRFITARFVFSFLTQQEGELGTWTGCLQGWGGRADKLVLEEKTSGLSPDIFGIFFSLYHLSSDTPTLLPSWNLVPLQYLWLFSGAF